MIGTRCSRTSVSIVRRISHRTAQFTNDDLGKVLPSHLLHIMEAMIKKNVAIYEPPKQTRSVMLYWRTPEEWAEVLHNWVYPRRLFGIYFISHLVFRLRRRGN